MVVQLLLAVSLGCFAAPFYKMTETVCFVPGTLMRVGIADRWIAQVVGMPEHAVWRLEKGGLFFESTAGLSFCVFDEFMTPYDVMAIPSAKGQGAAILPALPCKVTHAEVQRFMSVKKLLPPSRQWHNPSQHTVFLKDMARQYPDSILFMQSDFVAPGETKPYWVIPRVQLKRHLDTIAA